MNPDIDTYTVRLRYAHVMQDLRKHTTMLNFVTLQCTPRHLSVVWPGRGKRPTIVWPGRGGRPTVWRRKTLMPELHITRVSNGYWTFDTFYVEYSVSFNKKIEVTSWLKKIMMTYEPEISMAFFADLIEHDPQLFQH